MWTTLCPNQCVWILPVGLDFASGSGFCQWVWKWRTHGPDSLLYHVIHTQPWHKDYFWEKKWITKYETFKRVFIEYQQGGKIVSPDGGTHIS